MRRAWDFVKNNATVITALIVIITVVVTLTTSFTGVTNNMDILINNQNDMKNEIKDLKDEISDVKKDMGSFSAHIQTEMIENVFKQSDKITNDPNDIKILDIERVLREYEHISNKTDLTKLHYDKILNFYESYVKK